MQLTKTEEDLMNHLWKIEKAFMKDILEVYPDPKPAPSTVATLLKRMHDKSLLAINSTGNHENTFLW